MQERRLPVYPHLADLEKEAEALRLELNIDDPPEPREILARTYGAESWERLRLSCELIDAIWKDDVKTVDDLVTAHPNLIHENAGIRGVNWGPPLSYAANVGRDEIIRLLHRRGATDLEYAMGRAALQGRVETARMLHQMLGSPIPPRGSLGGPAYTLNVRGTEFLFDCGVELLDEDGVPYAPVDVVLETDSRSPERKHRILELYGQHGFVYPDTPTMALHRGRIDLLKAHIDRDPGLLSRTFSFGEIYPPELRCQPYVPGSYQEYLPRTPINGATLLHIAIEFDEMEVAKWLLDRGMNVDAPAAIDEGGFGGHTALFNAVVSYPHFWMNFTGGWAGTRKPEQSDFADMLLERGANPNATASFCERIDEDGNVSLREHRNITPLEWGEVFSNRLIVSEPAMRAIERAGGR